MGRKEGLYINPKKFGGVGKPCLKEMVSFLNCMALNQNNDEKCLRQKEIMDACVAAQHSAKRKALGTINYHLQRLSRALLVMKERFRIKQREKFLGERYLNGRKH